MNDTRTFSPDDGVRWYLPLMHELATRLDLVAHACDGGLRLTPPYAREYAYLQFRRICELIALGCLRLHGDLPETQTESARKEWNADRIMRLLHRSHPFSFPQAVIRTKTPKGWHIQANAKPNALTKDEFRKLYAECGQVLHKGTIQSIESNQALGKTEYQRVLDWQSKIVDLMNEHMIGRAAGAGFYVVSLRTTSGFPECSIFTPNRSGGLDVAIRRMDIAGEHEDAV